MLYLHRWLTHSVLVPMHLQPSTTLNERYLLQKRVSGDSRFAHVYQAVDQATNERVIVREYFPDELAERSPGGQAVRAVDGQDEAFSYGKEQFAKEAKALKRVEHEVVAPLVDAFEANGTVYQVTRLPKALPLDRVLKKRGKPLPLDAALSVTYTLLDALAAVHSKGLIHGGLTSQHVLVTKTGAPRLLSFQTAQILTVRRTGQEGLKPAHPTAPEQHQVNGKQGPWTDVYAVASMFYTLVTGETLAVPTNDTAVDPSHSAMPEALVPVLRKALAPRPQDRTRSPKRLASALKQAAETMGTASETNPPTDAVSDADAADSSGEEVQAAEVSAEGPVDSPDALSDTLNAEGEVVEVDAAEPPEESAATTEVPADEPDDATEDASEKRADAEALTQEPELEADERPIAELPEMIVVDDPDDGIASAPPAASVEEESLEDEHVDEPAVTEVASDENTAFEEAQEEEEPDENASDEKALPEMAEVQGPLPKAAVAAAADPQDVRHETEDVPAPAADASASDRSAESPKRKRSGRSRVIASVLGIVLVVVLAGGAYLYTIDVAGSGGGLQYASLTAQADSLFAAEDYALAGTFYQQARVVQPDDAHVQERLAEAENRLKERQRAAVAEHQSRGDALLADADSMLAANNTREALAAYTQANEAYLEALRNQPDHPELPGLINRTMEGINQTFSEREQLLEEERPDPVAVREELFAQYWAEGNELAEDGAFEQAERRLSQAQEFRPNDTEVAERLAAVRDSMATAAATENFRGLLQQASRLESQQRWSEASVAYQQALNSRPSDAEALAGLTRVEDALEEEQRLEQQYQYLRGQGDVLANQGRHQEAVQSYRQALEHRPSSVYLQDRIAELEEHIAALAAEDRRRNRTREDGVYLNTDTPVQLVGSLSDLYSEISYPSAAVRAGVSGRVFVQFVVTADGTVRDAEVVRGIGSGTDEEAIRVIRQASFEPATVDGQPVDAQHTLFIEFSLDDMRGDE